MNLRRAGGQGLFHGERRRLVFGVQGDLRPLGNSGGGYCRLLEVDFRGVKRNRGSRLQHLDINGFFSREGIVSKVGRHLELVVFGDHRAGEPRKLRETSSPRGKDHSPKQACDPGSLRAKNCCEGAEPIKLSHPISFQSAVC